MSEPIGELLREAREARGLTLEAASEATKIRARYLRALEAEDWDAMPAPAYARGFLRTYAAYLGLDADSIVEAYRRTTESTPAQPPAPPPEPPAPLAPGGLRGRAISWRVVAIGAVVVLLVVLYVVGVVGGGSGGGGSPKQAARHHHRHAHKQSPAPNPAPPTEASVSLRTTAEVWVCLIDENGKPLVNGEILPAGETRGPYRASAFELNMGNGSVQMQADDRDFRVPPSSSPLGYRITPSGVSPLAPADRPTCT